MNYYFEHRELAKLINKRAERNPRLGVLMCILSVVFMLAFGLTILVG